MFYHLLLPPCLGFLEGLSDMYAMNTIAIPANPTIIRNVVESMMVDMNMAEPKPAAKALFSLMAAPSCGWTSSVEQ